jgi:Flp pilus assembly protein CpaB
MRRGRIFVLFALVLIGVALAGYMIIQNSSTNGDGQIPFEPTPEIRDANIVIAAQDIPRGALIPADGVLLAAFPADMVVETMAIDVGQVVGRRARMDIARGIPITTNMVTEEAGDLLGTGSDAAIAIENGLTAISIPMTRLSGVAYAIRDGDSVDVLISMLVADYDTEFQTLLPDSVNVLIGVDGLLTGMVCDAFTENGECVMVDPPQTLGRSETDVSTGELLYLIPSEAQRPRLVTTRLIEKATVLHVGTFPLEDSLYQSTLVTTEQEGQTVEEPITSVSLAPDIITLIVNPQDALALNYAVKSEMDIVLTLRAPDDPNQFETSSVSLQYLFDNYNITVPAKLSFGLQPRIDVIVPPVLPNDGVTTYP